jgi:hypothetical protein
MANAKATLEPSFGGNIEFPSCEKKAMKMRNPIPNQVQNKGVIGRLLINTIWTN